MLQRVRIQNFRALAEVDLRLGPVNAFFGPNGAGKSSLLDALWFLRDCAIRGVGDATGDRDHGIGLLWDDETPTRDFSIDLETSLARYRTWFVLANGRIDPRAGESLWLCDETGLELINRQAGENRALVHHPARRKQTEIELREPTKLALGRYLDLDGETPDAALLVDQLLKNLRYYDSRSLDFYGLKVRGSEASYHFRLWDRASNLWSVLRNLKDRREIDPRYDTIESLMREAFPGKFRSLLIEQVGASVVAGSFIEEGRRKPIRASGASDGFLQLLILVTALFCEGPEAPSLVLFDEPDHSLHPHALAILANAIETAATSWRKQILLATHSPVLISQFEPSQVQVVDSDAEGRATFQRVSELPIEDLLETYAIGSLYMAEEVGAQSSA